MAISETNILHTRILQQLKRYRNLISLFNLIAQFVQNLSILENACSILNFKSSLNIASKSLCNISNSLSGYGEIYFILITALAFLLY